MQRRRFLKTLGGIGTVGGLGVGATVLSSGSANAVQQYFSTLDLASDTGEVDYIAVYGDAHVDWKGFDTPAQQVRVRTTGEIVREGETSVTRDFYDSGLCDLDADDFMGNRGTTSTGSGTRGTILIDIGLDEDGDHDPDTDWAIVQAEDYNDPYEIPENPVPADFLTVEEDGESRNFFGYMTDYYTFYDENGSELYEIEGDWELRFTVENITSTASDGGGQRGGNNGAVASTTNESADLD